MINVIMLNMKSRCHICNNDVSLEADKMMEKFIVGRIKCSNCGSTQKRYVSEADLLLYLSITYFLYMLLTIAAVYVYDNLGTNWLMLLGFFAILVLAYFIQKTLSRYIYNNAPFKKAIAYKVIAEDKDKIKKNINLQFIIFFMFAFGAIISKDHRIEFIGAQALDIIVTALRFILQVRNEKYDNKKAPK